MDKMNVKLNKDCHDCVRLSKRQCKGKVSSTPCIIHQSKKQYEKDSIKSIKEMIKNNK